MEWRDIPKYKGYYIISEEGRVRSLPRKVPIAGTGRCADVQGKLLKVQYDSRGELIIVLCNSGNKSRLKIQDILDKVFPEKYPKYEGIGFKRPEFTVKVKGDAGNYNVWAIDWLYQKMLVSRTCGDEWIDFSKLKINKEK